MSFKSEVHRVLIASPSDLTEEREVATVAINDWNDQHAAEEGVVLLPVKWETHAMPESGVSSCKLSEETAPSPVMLLAPTNSMEKMETSMISTTQLMLRTALWPGSLPCIICTVHLSTI